MSNISTWGDGTWGDGLWGIDTDDRAAYTPVIVDNWPFENVYPDENEAIYDLLVAYGVELDRLQEDIVAVGDATRLDLAEDEELERLAGEVGVTRETNESDDRLRERARIAKAVSRSDGTVEGLAEVLVAIFGRDTAAKMSVTSSSSEPVVELDLPQSIVDDSNLTESELEGELERTLPSSDALTIVAGDTLKLGSSGSEGLGADLT